MSASAGNPLQKLAACCTKPAVSAPLESKPSSTIFDLSFTTSVPFFKFLHLALALDLGLGWARLGWVGSW
jgi:hypothetical protein